ncbi:CPCC family cysteine-rich protein [Pendulispora albinea]|uniref:Cysteine-rich CPCC domain-containing protein n=1 Tax=Pendulispora albinea TaxID=2741071 RepID=A0ABZ2M813_9BACT
MSYACPCCRYLTLTEPPPGTFVICPVCFWEDDDAQFDDPNAAGGANAISLREAQANFAEFKASERQFVEQVRGPHANEIPPGRDGTSGDQARGPAPSRNGRRT